MDIVAIFFLESMAMLSVRRQLAWTYTSVSDVSGDYSGGGDPGATPQAHGSITLKVPSAGEGIYAVFFYRNSSAPYVPGLVPNGGAVMDSAFYFAAAGIPQPTPPLGVNSLPMKAAVSNFPADLGLEVDNGGLVCPAGTITPFPSNRVNKGGYVYN
jgi:hypothetical protein